MASYNTGNDDTEKRLPSNNDGDSEKRLPPPRRDGDSVGVTRSGRGGSSGSGASTSDYRPRGRGGGHQNRGSRFVDRGDFDDMLAKYRHFFSNPQLYGGLLRTLELHRLLLKIIDIETDNNTMRHQFLLRLVRTKILDITGPIISTIKEFIKIKPFTTDQRESAVTSSVEVLQVVIDLIIEILARIPHARNVFMYCVTINGFLLAIPEIMETSLAESLRLLGRELMDPNLLANKISDTTKTWSADLSFIGEPLVPPLQELLKGSIKDEYTNIIKGSYTSSAHYIETWYRLMQEDFIGPLRSALKDFLKTISDTTDRSKLPPVLRLNGGYHYNFTTVLEETRVDGEQFLLLQYSLEGLEHVDWDSSDRLRIGNMIVMSEDDFCTASYAVIARSQSEHEMQETTDTTVWVRTIEEITPFKASFQGIEPMSLFEPSRCVLERLKEVAARIDEGERLPMQEYLVEGKKLVGYPSYMNRDTEILIRDDNEVRLGDCSEFPEMNLDDSQTAALKLALTHEVALIQGPPGTGKSFVGAHVVDILMRNKHLWQQNGRGCIMLLAYTNHAIDQFVNECVALGMDMTRTLRVGSRADASMEEFLMKANRKGLGTLGEYEDLLNQTKNSRWSLNDAEYWTREMTKSLTAPLEEIPFHMYSEEIDQIQYDQFIEVYGEEFGHHEILHWMSGESELFTVAKKFNINEFDLDKLDMLSEREIWDIRYVFIIHPFVRRRLFIYWCKKAQSWAEENLFDYKEDAKYFRNEWLKCVRAQDKAVSERSEIIALTNTGACTNSHLVEAAKPTIVLVEEAAEVLESHIVAPLTSGCKHLILIGDHQQLRPQIAEYKLEKKNLSISLFERLVINAFPNQRLEIQHRMHPDIASILVPHIYPSLRHHDSVRDYPQIKGVQKRMIFFEHGNFEEKIGEKASRINKFEAEFLVGLYHYLIKQGYQSKEITILTTYRGQMRYIKDLVLKKITSSTLDETNDLTPENKSNEDIYNDRINVTSVDRVNVTTVDNYQGEENTIVLLSFVRSNDECNIGFLKWANRICVALSRAKQGFYAVGNFKLFASNTKSDIWPKLRTQLLADENMFLSSEFEIVCQIHGNVSKVKTGQDFKKFAPDGGCGKPCDYRLQCGHSCTYRCHTFDVQHSEFQCEKVCHGTMDCQHECLKLCCEKSDRNLRFSYKPQLNSQYRVCENCHKTEKCQLEVDIVPSCGHEGKTQCSDLALYKCQEKITRVLSCEHELIAECNKEESDLLCEEMIEISLECGHEKSVSCSLATIQSGEKKIWKPKILLCNKIVAVKLKCGHEITKVCHTRVVFPVCHAKVLLKLECNHDKEVLCPKSQEYRDIDIYGTLDAERLLKKQQNLIECREHVLVQLECGHEIEAECDKVTKYKIISDKLHKKTVINCVEQVSVELKCGHHRMFSCFAALEYKQAKRFNFHARFPGPIFTCKEKVEKVFACGHHNAIFECHETPTCKEIVTVDRTCAHILHGKCWEVQERKSVPCEKLVESVKPCGHKSRVKCNKVQRKTSIIRQECDEPCSSYCSHNFLCLRKCGMKCKTCKRPCAYKCVHSKCSKLCYEECDRKPCDQPCRLKLKCRHTCGGLCGEPCPLRCSICNKGTPKGIRIRVFPCGHDLLQKDLDERMLRNKDNNTTLQEIHPVICPVPRCGMLITYCPRYANVIKRYTTTMKRADYDASKLWLYCKKGQHVFSVRADEAVSHDYCRPDDESPDEESGSDNEDDIVEEAHAYGTNHGRGRGDQRGSGHGERSMTNHDFRNDPYQNRSRGRGGRGRGRGGRRGGRNRGGQQRY